MERGAWLSRVRLDSLKFNPVKTAHIFLVYATSSPLGPFKNALMLLARAFDGAFIVAPRRCEWIFFRLFVVKSIRQDVSNISIELPRTDLISGIKIMGLTIGSDLKYDLRRKKKVHRNMRPWPAEPCVVLCSPSSKEIYGTEWLFGYSIAGRR